MLLICLKNCIHLQLHLIRAFLILKLNSRCGHQIKQFYVYRCIFLSHQTRFSAIFTNANKSYLTYPYPTRGIDKIENQHVLLIHWLYRKSCNSVVKTFGDDVIATSHTTSNFNMADVNVWEPDSCMWTPTLKSNAVKIKRYARKRIYHGCLVRI